MFYSYMYCTVHAVHTLLLSILFGADVVVVIRDDFPANLSIDGAERPGPAHIKTYRKKPHVFFPISGSK
jgi:hypothetical protein